MNDLLALRLADWQQLLRLRLTAMVVASTAVGYLLFQPAASARGLAAMLAVALLTSGCTVLNQLQERSLDALMSRTACRPLAAGRLSPRSGLALAGLLALPGLCLLAWLEGRALLLGLFALAWYNGIYTPLKRRTSLAVIPGSLCGALPPLIGWCVAGGAIGHPAIGLVCGLLILWQVPHFLLFVSRHREDYRRAGLPLFAETIPQQRLRSVLTLWLAAVAIAGLMLPAFGLLHEGFSQLFVLLLSLGLLAATWWFGRQAQWGRLFVPLNLFMGLVLMILACDRLLLSLF